MMQRRFLGDHALDELLVNLSSLSGDLAGRNQSLNSLITDFADGNAATVLLHPNPHVTMFGISARLFDVAALLATAGLVVAFVVSVVGNTRALYRTEPFPRA